MIADSIVLYVGLGIVIAARVWNHWKAAQPDGEVFTLMSTCWAVAT
jgi:hypothetical protein